MSAGNYSVLIGGKPWANADKADLITVSRTLNAAAVAEVRIKLQLETVQLGALHAEHIAQLKRVVAMAVGLLAFLAA